MRNEYPGTCYRWKLQHADCAIRWRGQPAPTKEQAKAARHPADAPSA